LSLSSLVARLADQVPTSTDGRVIVIVAIVGAVGTVTAAWAQGNRIRRQATEANKKADVAQTRAAEVADSVGPINGHGTVQDATGTLIEEFREWREEIRLELRATRTTVESIVTAAGGVNERLKAHDREIAELKRQAEGEGS